MQADDELKIGDVVFLTPMGSIQTFARQFMIVTEVYSWGAQGYVRALPKRDANGRARYPGDKAYYKAEWDEMTLVGRAQWIWSEDAH